MSSEINLFITMSDGTVRKITISDKKPIGALFEALIAQEGRPVYALFKNGREIPKSREMIKFVPLRNGDKLTEGESRTQNTVIHAYRNTILRKQVRLGQVKQEDVMEVKIVDINGNSILVLVKTTATVDDLKKAASELFNRNVNELLLNGNIYLGWSGDIKNSLSRVYDGSKKLTEFGVADEKILIEVVKPKTIQEEEVKRKMEEEERKRKEEKERQWQEAQRRAYEQYVKEQQEYAKRMYEEYERTARQQQKQQQQRAAPTLSKEEKCIQILRTEGIVDKPSYLKWALANHPDKFPDASPEEKEKIKEKIQIINDCVDILKIKNIKGVKKGGRRTRKYKKNKSRKGRKGSRKN